MFDRIVYKENAKVVYKGNVWICILAAGIVKLVGMVFGGSNTGVEVSTNTSNGVTVSSNIAGIPVINELTQVGLTLSVVFLALVAVAISIAVSLFVINILQIGKAKFFLDAREGNYDINNILYAYKNGYLQNAVIVKLITDLKIAVYTLFFIVPGIMKSYELRFVNYILAENPSLSWQEVHELSTAMTDGYKMDLFVMDLSFFGWHMFDSLTFGIGQFLTAPYYEATDAEAYAALSLHRNEASYNTFEV
ncbi:MAG: DUF975 family protein [Erysipelotrichales bacterium]|nr:DUF975 family protein [Erysipelotrichales bacterium]